MNIARRHPATAFFVLALLLTYVVGIAAHLALAWLQGAAGTDLANVNDLVMRFGPSIAGLAAAWLASGRAGATAIVQRIFRWRAPSGTWLLVLLLPPALTVVALVLQGHAQHLQRLDPAHVLAVYAVQLLLASVFAGLGEELGWRGFLLPQLAARMTRLKASAVVAVAWLAWHVPAYLLFNKGGDDPFLPFAMLIVPLSLVLTWLYCRPGGSLLFPILLHGALNASFYSLQIVLPEASGQPGFQPGFDWTLAWLWVGAATLMVAATHAWWLRRGHDATD